MDIKELIEEIKRNTFYLDYMSIEEQEDNEGTPVVDIQLYIDTLQMSEDNYKEYEDLCDKFEVVTDGLATCNYDLSGYNYWTEDNEESNYAFVTIYPEDITEDNIDKVVSDIDNLYENIIALYDIEEISEEEE